MPNLILIPTDRERRVLQSALTLPGDRWQIHTIGFGVIDSAINTTRLLTSLHPEVVLVAGIAGLFDRPANGDHAIGDAVWFSQVQLDGIGVGQYEQFLDATALGWKSNLPNDPSGAARLWLPGRRQTASLVTACAASASPREAQWRMERFPAAVAEDMESYAVALACAAFAVHCGVVRGLSNHVGCRDHSRWKIDEALINVASELQPFLTNRSQ